MSSIDRANIDRVSVGVGVAGMIVGQHKFDFGLCDAARLHTLARMKGVREMHRILIGRMVSNCSIHTVEYSYGHKYIGLAGQPAACARPATHRAASASSDSRMRSAMAPARGVLFGGARCRRRILRP